MQRTFASDNAAPAHPAILAAITAANQGQAVSYGDDLWTQRAVSAFRREFGKQTEVYFTFNGTGANVVALCSLLQPFEAVIAPASAHLNTDECGALERFGGMKIVTVQTPDGKLTPELLEPYVFTPHEEHHVQPRAISISQTTEYGGVYTLDELRALSTFARKHRLLFHMDGARVSNAAAALQCTLREMTADCGVDVLSFGGTKNGLLFGEAILFFNPAQHGDRARYIRKQGMQLASKMRFIAAQFEALLTDDLWLENARHANEMAQRLAERARAAGADITRPVEANAIFVRIPIDVAKRLQEQFFFYMFDEHTGEARWMTSFDTTLSDIDQFISLYQGAAAARR